LFNHPEGDSVAGDCATGGVSEASLDALKVLYLRSVSLPPQNGQNIIELSRGDPFSKVKA
jgi:hypothetical protein